MGRDYNFDVLYSKIIPQLINMMFNEAQSSHPIIIRAVMDLAT
jgi:hypothetical protein